MVCHLVSHIKTALQLFPHNTPKANLQPFTTNVVINFAITTTVVYVASRIRNNSIMSQSKKYQPTESELEILQVLWEKGKASVREVHETLSQKRETAIRYTTTLKQMQRMYEDKKVLGRTGLGRSHVYHAAIQENDIQQQLFDRLLDTAFKGSAMDMVMHALGHENVSESELDELQQWLETKKKGKKS